jgi:outer membrane protein assembly factor BamB
MFGRKAYCISSLLLVLTVTAASGQPGAFDWPQWQGSGRDAVSQEHGLLQEWPQAGPKLAWKAGELGGGDSTPSIAAGRILGMGNLKNEEVVWALSEKDGSRLWVQKIGPAFHQDMPQSKEGPAATPTVEGDRLYVVGLAGDVVCMNVADGKIIWRRSLTKDFGGKIPRWSFRESPLIDGEKVVVTPGGKGATLVTLNKLTGETIWSGSVPGDPGAAYSSAIAIDIGGQRQYVQLTAKTLVGVAAADGKFLWKYDPAASTTGINCATPVYHDGTVFASSAYGNGGGLVRLKKAGTGDTTAEEIYFTKKMQNHHGGMIVLDGYLYGANGGNGGGFLVCMKLETGDIMWSERRVPKGSIAYADGRLYYRTEDVGSLLLIEPSPKEYLERGRFEQPGRTSKPAWSHPVIANGKLYVRDQDTLLCYEVKAKP